MKTRKTLSQKTLDRLAMLYEYADSDLAAGDEERTIEIGTAPRPAAADGKRQQAAESERLLRHMLQAHEGVPACD